MSTASQRFWNQKPVRVLMLLIALSLSGGCQSSFYYNCHEGGEIEPAKKSAITAASLQFVQMAFAGEVDAAYGKLSEAAKANSAREQFAAVLQVFKTAGPFDGFQIERIMTLTGWGDTSKSSGIAICSKDVAHPERGVTIAMQKIPEQAYVLVSAKGNKSKETWIAVIWLVPHAEKWEVQSFHATIETALGKREDDFLSMARIEKNRGHYLNAVILYSGAASLAERGPFYRTGNEDIIQQESQRVAPPQEFRGSPPYTLAGSNGPFSIFHLNPIPLNGKLYLVIAHEVTKWKDAHEIEQKNHALITIFAKRFPEYSDVFGGLVAEATARGGNNGWRTVEAREAILTRAPSPAKRKQLR